MRGLARRLRARGTRPLLLLAAATAAILLGVGLEGDPGGTWVEVARRDLLLEVELSGELEAVRSVAYQPPPIPDVWEYKIAFLAEEGSVVEAGDPVVGFDTSELEQRLLRRIADRDAAQKTLEKREQELEVERRDAALALAEARSAQERAELKADLPTEVASRQDLKTAAVDRDLAADEAAYRETYLAYLKRLTEAELEVLRQERDRQVAKVAEIESKIEKMTVRALQGGTVIYETDWQGNKKKVGDRVWRGDSVLQIPDLGEMRANAEVAEAHAGRLSLGQPVRFTLDAHPGRTYRAAVRKIGRTVERRSWRDPRKVVRLELELEQTDAERMRPGMRLQGAVEVDRLEGTLALPLDAVVLRREGPAVRVRSPLGARWVEPELGRRTTEWVEVVAGLSEGDRVLRESE